MLSDLNLAPPVELFQLQKDYQDDNAAQKINLGLGAYRTEEGLPWVLPVVTKAELRIAEMHKHEVQNTFIDTFMTANVSLMIAIFSLNLKTLYICRIVALSMCLSLACQVSAQQLQLCYLALPVLPWQREEC